MSKASTKTKAPKTREEPCPLCGDPIVMVHTGRGRWESQVVHHCSTGPGRYKIPDEEILAAYRETGSVRRAGERIGRSKATVQLRLRQMGVELPPPGGVDGVKRSPRGALSEWVGAKVTPPVAEWIHELARSAESSPSEAMRNVLDKAYAEAHPEASDD